MSSYVAMAAARGAMCYSKSTALADLQRPESWSAFSGARQLRRRWFLHMGATNSGKTHEALKHLFNARTGIYLAPLRLLAWEVFERMRSAGLHCALRTGQEQLGPDDASHVACTIEMAPLKGRTLRDPSEPSVWEVAVVDEAQLVSDPNRGAAWTRALLGLKAMALHLCGSPSDGLEQLFQAMATACGDALKVRRFERLAPLLFDEAPVELSSLQAEDCLLCFSRVEVLAAKKQLEGLGFRVAVIYGGLPPEVRQHQARLFNAQEAEVLVASDAIGLGLNLRIRRVIFASFQKFDGEQRRFLSASELRQLAGRAGRGRRPGHVAAAKSAESDVARLRDALEASVDERQGTEVQAALLPLPEHLEAFSQCLERDLGALPFAELVERFLAVADVSPLYMLAQAKTVIRLAHFLEDIRLHPSEKYVFCQAPISPDMAAMTALHGFARDFVSGAVVFPDLAGVDGTHGMDGVDMGESELARKVLELENLHKVCDTYLWLASRFPSAFVDAPMAEKVRRHVSLKISKALRPR
ncbi:unnamed protein product [Effrenium voratum]|uniref:Helicase C-terminal domain-containing protein n=1 Tax=Effrenium voratum TaxID=2562239 RepID=A0AA36N0G8_9DINO|nr:unnamed protein product [Effrenium voratum]